MMSAGDAVASDILVSYPQSTLLSVARVLISLLIAFSYPLQCLPSRASATTLWISAQAACCDDVDPRAGAASHYVYRGLRERYGVVRRREPILPFDLVIKGSFTDLSIGAFPRIREPRETPDAFLYK